MSQNKPMSDETSEHQTLAPEYELRLFVTGASPNSTRAISNLKNLCETYMSGNYSLEIIDVYQEDELKESDEIVALPMLIRKKPLPERRMIGDMSDRKKVLRGLGIND